MNPAEARALLARHGLAPARQRGQNFLCDEALAHKLVQHAGVTEACAVLEIGAGLGILTRALAARARRVCTVEVDAGLVRALQQEQLLPPEVQLLHSDALRLNLRAQLAALAAPDGAPLRVVANLPYSVAAPLLRRFLECALPAAGAPSPLAGWGVMLQRELAARLQAQAGARAYGGLSVLHQWVARARRALPVHARCFFPAPKVQSVFVVFETRARPLAADAAALARGEKFVRAGFSQRRKTLANALRAAGIPTAATAAALAQQGLNARARAEALSPEAWWELVQRLSAAGCAPA